MHITDIIRKAGAEGKPRFSFELLPPLKGDGTQRTFEAIDPLMEFSPIFCSVTYHREDVKYVEKENGLLERHTVRRRPGTVGISAAIMQRYGLTVIPHLICGGQSRYDIEDALIDLDFLGIQNVLALRGDNLKRRTHVPQPPGRTPARVGAGRADRTDEPRRFHRRRGRTVPQHEFLHRRGRLPEKHAEAPNKAEDLRRLKEKVDAGAAYIITQMSFDSAKILSFIDDCRAAGIDVPIVPGIKPFSTKAQLTMLPQIFHVDLPEALVETVKRCNNNAEVREAGVEWAIAQGRELIAAGIPSCIFTDGKDRQHGQDRPRVILKTENLWTTNRLKNTRRPFPNRY